MIRKFINMMLQVGVTNTVVGALKLRKYNKLQEQYEFYEWNRMPFELRKYIQEAAKIINKDEPECVVDIGCGLGELLRHINARYKVGVDIDERSITVAKLLDKAGEINFFCGSFDQIQDIKADYIVTLNFMGGHDTEYWKPYYRKLLEDNYCNKILVDVLPEKDGNHHLDFREVLPSNYYLITDKGPFMAGRHIQVFERIKNSYGLDI